MNSVYSVTNYLTTHYMYRSCNCIYQFFNFDYLLLLGFTVYYCFASCFFFFLFRLSPQEPITSHFHQKFCLIWLFLTMNLSLQWIQEWRFTHSSDCEKIKYLTAVSPGISITILILTLICKQTIHIVYLYNIINHNDEYWHWALVYRLTNFAAYLYVSDK